MLAVKRRVGRVQGAHRIARRPPRLQQLSHEAARQTSSPVLRQDSYPGHPGARHASAAPPLPEREGPADSHYFAIVESAERPVEAYAFGPWRVVEADRCYGSETVCMLGRWFADLEHGPKLPGPRS